MAKLHSPKRRKKKKKTLSFLSISLLLVENHKDFNARAHMSNKKGKIPVSCIFQSFSSQKLIHQDEPIWR